MNAELPAVTIAQNVLDDLDGVAIPYLSYSCFGFDVEVDSYPDFAPALILCGHSFELDEITAALPALVALLQHPAIQVMCQTISTDKEI